MAMDAALRNPNPPQEHRDAHGAPPVAVVMALHKPVMAQVKAQLASLLAQKGVRLHGTAMLDGAETAADGELRALLDDAGFALVATAEAQGARAAFAKGLKVALGAAEENALFAYCDQDDVWHAQKLARLAGFLAETRSELVYCDARVVEEGGRLIAPSLHRFESREEPQGLLQHLLLNAVSGMTALFTRRTAELAVALMRDCEDNSLLHDHLTALAAASLGETWHLAEPLVDYVQHAGNALGAKPHMRAWKKRTLGVGPLSLYRATSRAMFEQRRSAAQALARAGVLPRKLEAMFLTRRPGFFEFEYAYANSVLALLAQGQYRRAMLCIRMWDAALSQWVKGS
jgi:hypothetical protein